MWEKVTSQGQRVGRRQFPRKRVCVLFVGGCHIPYERVMECVISL